MTRIEIRYEGLNPEWLAAMKDTNCTIKDGSLVYPAIVVRDGQTGTIEMIRERIISTDGSRLNEGATCVLKTGIKDGRIRLSGLLVLRRPLADQKPKDPLPTILTFETREILFDERLESGKEKRITTKNSGAKREGMIVTATIIDAAGRPVAAKAEGEDANAGTAPE
jgi:hypothetical protein